MSTAAPAPQWTSDEWRDWLIDAIGYLNQVHGVTFVSETLPPELVARFYRRLHVVVLRIGADLEDQAQVVQDVLSELGLQGLFGIPGTTPRPRLYLVPDPRPAEPSTWSHPTIYVREPASSGGSLR